MSLKLIDSQKLSKIIKEPYVFTLKTDNSAIYLIEITASVKSRLQNHSFNKQADDELSIQIVDQPDILHKVKSAIWNGNELKNLQKTVVLIIYLEKGNHQWQLIPKNKPYIEQINVYQNCDDKIEFIPAINNPSQDGNCRPWYSLILLNLGLEKITVRAKAKKQSFSFDDDDLKIVINDGNPFKNETNKSHKDWFWCGKILKGKSKEFSYELNISKEIHTIDFYADRTPLLEKLIFEFKTPFQPVIKIQPYKNIDQNDYNRFDNEIVNAVDFWNNEFSKQKYSPDELLDPNLIKAIIYIETRMGYGSGSNSAYPDVMQVADELNPAIHTLNNDGWIDPNTGKITRESEFINENEFWIMDYNNKANGKTSEQSIYWGIRWLYHKAQKFYGTGSKGELDPPYVREWKSWKQAVMDYNDSPRKVEYQKEVFQLYEKGIDPEGGQLW